jgi:hypothetical protein
MLFAAGALGFGLFGYWLIKRIFVTKHVSSS